MSDRVGPLTAQKDPIRTALRFGVTVAGAALGARSVSTAVARAWIGTKAIDSAAGTLHRSVR